MLVLLDWEKAIHKVTQQKSNSCFETLNINIPDKIVNHIAAIYAKPSFEVKCGDETTQRNTRTTEYAKVAH